MKHMQKQAVVHSMPYCDMGTSIKKKSVKGQGHLHFGRHWMKVLVLHPVSPWKALLRERISNPPFCSYLTVEQKMGSLTVNASFLWWLFYWKWESYAFHEFYFWDFTSLAALLEESWRYLGNKGFILKLWGEKNRKTSSDRKFQVFWWIKTLLLVLVALHLIDSH